MTAKRWQVGDKVCALTNGGGYAEYVTINTGQCLPIPQGVSLVDAAGLPTFTVWSNVFHGHDIPEGVLLVHGGAGGIGATAINWAKPGAACFRRGTAACSFVTALGAERAIDYRDEDFVLFCATKRAVRISSSILLAVIISRNIRPVNPMRLISLAFNKGSKLKSI